MVFRYAPFMCSIIERYHQKNLCQAHFQSKNHREHGDHKVKP